MPVVPQGPVAEVGPSIDPHFFTVGPAEHPDCGALRAAATRDLRPILRNPGELPLELGNSLRGLALIGCVPP